MTSIEPGEAVCASSALLQRRSLVCSHGAVYEPRDGLCTLGPCKGMQLTALKIEERDGKVYCLGTD